MYDNSLYFASIAKERSSILKEYGLEQNGFVLVTVHRDNNTDDPQRLNNIFRTLLELHTRHGLDFVLPVHPRTRKMMDALLAADLKDALKKSPRFLLVPPAGFLDMIALESAARLVITDSGGVQKEAYFFGKPGVVLRPETEWVELVQKDQAVLADADPARITAGVERYLRDGIPDIPPLFGDGHAAERICDELLKSW
jgi:UDP-GlcNAc3NAcA epimerase